MAISMRDHKMLWGRAGNRCAMPDCRRELTVDAAATTDVVLIGEECHIIARQKAGPRGAALLAPDRRDSYDNLILLCSVHHAVIDSLPAEYSVEHLHAMKAEHETWVRASLQDFDAVRQRDEELYSEIGDQWEEMAHISEWTNWTEWMLSHGQPRIWAEVLDDLKRLRMWLFSRVWPKRFASLESAYLNFRLVLTDLINVFEEHSESDDDFHTTSKFYVLDEWDEELDRKLSRQFTFHVDLVMDLMLELTRAANYVCDMIRENLDASYRLRDGALIVRSGPYMDLKVRSHRVEYGDGERVGLPYPGLARFLEARVNRDRHVGLGTSAEDPAFIDWDKGRS